MATIDEQVQAFVEALVDEAWQRHPATGICRPFLKDKLTSILKFQAVDFVVGLATHLDRRDVQSILPSLPELWMQFGIANWAGIMRRLSPRPPRTFADWSGRYADVEFMALYLRINPLAIACAPQTGLTVADQSRICEFCRDEADVLFLGEGDDDDLNGELLCSIQELDVARGRLIAEDDSVAASYADADSLREYVNTLLISIGPQ